MKRGFFKIMLLFGFVWLGYANMHLLDQMTRRFRDADQGIKTKMEMVQIAKCVQMHFVDNNCLPAAAEFPVMIRECTRDEGRKLAKDAAQDIWGTLYGLAPVKAGFYVVCAGPDKTWSTKDDISFYQTMGNLGQSESGIATNTAAPAATSMNAGNAPASAQPRPRATPVRQAPAKPQTPMEYAPRQFTPREFKPREFTPREFTPRRDQ